ncbi:YdcF family protein [Anaeromyxobacter oryzae]|uniref:DUF218 domain-containing protein n=1 Tax=Anaeromyxobacter oryzae TaxID=2918170 RepID=A0ABM7WQP2_9BACT|nr:YdcF family protein [Anaeromyxobacter oryzae]BDG01783.1 hypothetical protein AMOR_07790 [Anaeromyxobacter oryzae]
MTPPVFVALSKVLDLAVAPLSWAIVLVLAGLLLRRRRPGLAAALPLLGVTVLVLFALEPVSRRVVGAVEAGAPDTFHPDPPYDVVIVLGGMVDASASRASGAVELTAAADRIVRAAALLRAGQARDVLLSGGLVFPVPGDRPEADQLRRVLLEAGVAPERIFVESASRNTRENAVESARIVRERGWRRLLLVTSAAHMPRALGCFRAAGLEPDALPVDRRAGDGRGASWLPRAEELAASTDALREATGRLVYHLLGWTR